MLGMNRAEIQDNNNTEKNEGTDLNLEAKVNYLYLFQLNSNGWQVTDVTMLCL